jgi:hypothetical protein
MRLRPSDLVGADVSAVADMFTGNHPRWKAMQ